ncbi:MAG: outer membrane protein transport protein [Bacteroidota bacterium]|nr:outer membrane protein transport protein [Bacteroidota bacterium]
MKKINFLIFILVSPFCILQAQTVDDALRYSQLNVYGTSRFSAMSGAFGALGGDFGASSTNPAGLAIFRSSEFTVTPSVFGKNTSTTFLNQVRDDNNINLNFSNIGFVGANVFEQPTNGWMSTAFSVGYNRTNNFDSNVLIAGENQNSSLLDVFVSQANARGGLTPERLDPFGALLAYQANLIFDADTAPNNFRYESDIPNAGPAGINQRKSIVTSGGMGELLFSYAGNYDDRLYLGGTIGYSSIRYNYFSRHHEEALPDTNHILDSFTYTDEFKTSGGGVNLKIGVLYRVFDWLRLGGAVHTPTFYNLTDTYGNSMTSNFKSGFTFYDTTVSATGSFNYRLTTPMRAIGSVAFVIARQGLISADYEFVDYSASRFSATNTDFSNVNTATRESLTSAGNIRLGAEWRFDPFAIRAGYSNQGNPYRGGFNNGSINSYSVGFGIREEAFFLDFAYILAQVRDQRLFIYDPAFVSPANVNTNTNTIMATFGMRF